MRGFEDTFFGFVGGAVVVLGLCLTITSTVSAPEGIEWETIEFKNPKLQAGIAEVIQSIEIEPNIETVNQVEDDVADESKVIEEEKIPLADKPCLNRYDGVFDGPSGKETYYNLDMGQVVKYMRDLGYDEKHFPYHVRDDGVKMLGQYIIIAADLKKRPKGTILPTSLGLGIVCDTGDFVESNPTQIDIAVNW